MARNPEINIINAGINNIPAIQELARLAWFAHYPGIITHAQIEYMLGMMYSTNRISNEIKEGQIEWLLAHRGIGIEAFASWGPHSSEKYVARLHKLYAHPQSKGSGFGKALLSEVEKRATNQGYKSLELNVNRENPTIEFYIKAGFSIFREDLIDIGEGYEMRDFLMRKSLNG